MLEVLSAHEKGRREVCRESAVPVRESHVRNRYGLRDCNRVVDDEHLDWASVTTGEGRKEVDDGGFVGEIGLDDVEGGACL